MDDSENKLQAAEALWSEAQAERTIANTPGAQVLQRGIIKAVEAYCEYLGRNGLFYGEERNWMRALQVTCYEWGDIDILLKDGALDRCYGDNFDSDPDDRALDPTCS